MEASRPPHTFTHVPPPGTQTPLPSGEAVLIGLAALAIVLIPFLWPLAQHLSVMAHEGAHAATASLLGFTLFGVKLNPDATGATSGHFPPGPRDVLVTFVGYLGPSACGAGAAKLISTGHIVIVLWLAIILLALLLLLIRWSFGLFSVPAAIALLVWMFRDMHTGTEVLIAYGLAWVLLLSGIRVAMMRGADAADAHYLGHYAFLPRHLWALLWLVGTVAALLYGGNLLVLG